MYVLFVQVCQSSFYHSIIASTNIVINADLIWFDLIWFDLFRFPYIRYLVKDHMDVEIVKITIKKKYIE
jgi:hypothetical protein